MAVNVFCVFWTKKQRTRRHCTLDGAVDGVRVVSGILSIFSGPSGLVAHTVRALVLPHLLHSDLIYSSFSVLVIINECGNSPYVILCCPELYLLVPRCSYKWHVQHANLWYLSSSMIFFSDGCRFCANWFSQMLENIVHNSLDMENFVILHFV